MDPSGANRALLLTGILGLGGARPSALTHGGLRWFLAMYPVENETYPDGTQRKELCAISAVGDLVQLTVAPALQTRYNADAAGLNWSGNAYPRWLSNDSGASFIAREWGTDGQGQPLISGVYVYAMDLSWDAAGIPSAASDLRRLPIALPQTADPWANISGFVWSPDASKVAYSSGIELHVVDAATGGGDTIIATATPSVPNLSAALGSCEWSPDGFTISFYDRLTYGIQGVAPDGSNRRTVIPGDPRNNRYSTTAFWSPSGANVLYLWSVSPKNQTARWSHDTYRATSSGANPANLTSDFADAAYPLGWRAAE